MALNGLERQDTKTPRFPVKNKDNQVQINKNVEMVKNIF